MRLKIEKADCIKVFASSLLFGSSKVQKIAEMRFILHVKHQKTPI